MKLYSKSKRNFVATTKRHAQLCLILGILSWTPCIQPGLSGGLPNMIKTINYTLLRKNGWGGVSSSSFNRLGKNEKVTLWNQKYQWYCVRHASLWAEFHNCCTTTTEKSPSHQLFCVRRKGTQKRSLTRTSALRSASIGLGLFLLAVLSRRKNTLENIARHSFDTIMPKTEHSYTEIKRL